MNFFRFFKSSLVVHFFSSRTDSKPVFGNQLHEAYSYLGPKMCPLSFPGIIKAGHRRDRYVDTLRKTALSAELS